jgi:hypothetical protein
MSHIADSLVSEGLTDTKSFRTQALVAATAAVTTTLSVSSEHTTIFTGTVVGQILKLGDATTYQVGHLYVVHNSSSASVAVQNNPGTGLFSLQANQRGTLILQNNSTAAGIWVYVIQAISNAAAGSLLYKSGTIAAGSFTGTPRTSAVTFTTAFPSTNYTITVTGSDARQWSFSSKATSGFTINSNANGALSANVDWQAIAIGEST